MSGSSEGPTSTQRSGPPAWLAPYAQSFLGAGAQAAQLPYQRYTGQRVANQSPLTRGANRGIAGNMFGSAITDAADNNLLQTLNGNFDNPFSDQVLAPSMRQASDAFLNATGGTSNIFNGAGAFGGSAHLNAQRNNADMLAQNLTDMTGRLNYQNYDSERNRQMSAASQAYQGQNSAMDWLNSALRAGAMDQGYEQQLLDSQYGDFQEANNYPWQQLGRFSDILGRAQGGAGTTTTTQGPAPDRGSQALGGGLLALSALTGGGNSGGRGK